MDNFIAHILVVDDDDGIRSLVKKYLNENNFLISTANSAEDAAEKIKIEVVLGELPGEVITEREEKNNSNTGFIIDIDCTNK